MLVQRQRSRNQSRNVTAREGYLTRKTTDLRLRDLTPKVFIPCLAHQIINSHELERGIFVMVISADFNMKTDNPSHIDSRP